jgi:hypothetical protein
MKGIVKIGNNSSTLLAGFSILLASMSLAAAFYQNYIYTRQLDILQKNVSRGEYIRTCKEIIEAYFQVKLKIGLIARMAERERGGNGGAAESMMEAEAANSISRFAALGTYLANFQNEDTRFQYTQLSWTLEKILVASPHTPPGDLGKLFEPADKLFSTMNEDCVRTAKAAPL